MKKICINIVELENCYKLRKFSQSFLLLDKWVRREEDAGEGPAVEGTSVAAGREI